jgi:hypothetical protein
MAAARRAIADPVRREMQGLLQQIKQEYTSSKDFGVFQREVSSRLLNFEAENEIIRGMIEAEAQRTKAALELYVLDESHKQSLADLDSQVADKIAECMKLDQYEELKEELLSFAKIQAVERIDDQIS